MDATKFLAQFWGWFSVITAVVYLAGGEVSFKKLLRMHRNRSFVFLSGWVLLSLGLITVILHNVWVLDWRVIITIAGWASTLKGITRIGFPKVTQKLVFAVFKDKITRFRIAMVIVGLLGAWLVYMG